MEFAPWVYRVHRGARSSRWSARAPRCGSAGARSPAAPEVALVVLAIAGVLGGVAAAYMQRDAAPRAELPEQGRYAFTACPRSPPWSPRR